MPTFNFTKTYIDGETPTAKDLENLRNSIESGINVTKLDATNFQTDAIVTAALKDETFLKADLPGVGHQVSTSSSNFSTANTSLTDVDNLTVTITTTGRPVFLTLISGDPDVPSTAGLLGPSDNSGATVAQEIVIDRGGATIASFDLNMDGGAGSPQNQLVPPGVIKYLDVVTAATYTYKIRTQVITGTGSPFANVAYVKLIAYEL
jgi:hypothetical protein